jgi:hypothetical protein
MKRFILFIAIILAFTSCGDSPTQSSPIITYFNSSSYTITLNENVTLSWDVNDSTSVRITGVGDVPSKGSVTVTPRVTTTYTMNASNQNALVQQSLTITVR